MKQSLNRHRLGIALACALGAAATTCAQAQGADQLEEVDVIGRALPGAVVGDIPPENSLSQRDIRAYGVGTVSQLLEELSLQTTSGQSRDGGGPVVLVNGKRVSGVNEVGNVPTEAILRVDILPEEVALKYGYSSDQKVVNIILRRRFNAMTGEGSASQSTEGGNARERADGSLTRIRDDQRLNAALGVQLQGDILEAQRGIIPANSKPVSDPAYRSLQPDNRNVSGNFVYATPFTQDISSSTNLTAAHTESRSLNGLFAGAIPEPLHRLTTGNTVHLGSTLNMDTANNWHLSVIGGVDHSDTRTAVNRSFPGATAPSLDRTTSISNTANVSMLATHKLFRAPAGDALMSLQGGAQTSSTQSSATGLRPQPAQSLSRSNGSARLSLDLPITRRGNWGDALGTLTANANLSLTQDSYFQTLTMLGYGLNWSPVSAINLIAAVSEDRRAPTLQQLLSPTVTLNGVTVYDYATGRSVLVTSITGGNAALVADDRHTFKLGGTFKPFANRNFTLNANYSDSVVRRAVQSLQGISPSLEAAFPDRFVRNEDDELQSVDSRPVNIASQSRSSLRWGFNLTQTLREPQRPQFGDRPRPVRPPGTAPATPPRAGEAAAPVPAAPAAAGSTTREPTLEEVQVSGRNEPAQGSAPGARGLRGGRGGGGGPGGGFPGGGFGGPGGGFGGGGFARGGAGPGRGGGFPGGGGDDGAQLQLSIYHTVLFRNEVTLRPGVDPVDLLRGGTIGSAPTPRHQVQFNAGVLDNGLGLRLSGEWSSAGHTDIPTSVSGGLHYGAHQSLDLRSFADLGQRLPRTAWARGLRVTFAVQNLFNERQVIKTDTGIVPQAFQAGYLDPAGRTVGLSVRKIF